MKITQMFAILIIAIIFSCSNNNDIQPSPAASASDVRYVLNEKQVTKKDFNAIKDDNFISVQGFGKDNSIYGFTDEKLFLAWLKDQDGGEELLVKFSLAIELRDYAIKNGIIEEFERTERLERTMKCLQRQDKKKSLGGLRLWAFLATIKAEVVMGM